MNESGIGSGHWPGDLLIAVLRCPTKSDKDNGRSGDVLRTNGIKAAAERKSLSVVSCFNRAMLWFCTEPWGAVKSTEELRLLKFSILDCYGNWWGELSVRHVVIFQNISYCIPVSKLIQSGKDVPSSTGTNRKFLRTVVILWKVIRFIVTGGTGCESFRLEIESGVSEWLTERIGQVKASKQFRSSYREDSSNKDIYTHIYNHRSRLL